MPMRRRCQVIGGQNSHCGGYTTHQCSPFVPVTLLMVRGRVRMSMM
jgi:hypothetical protein